MVIYPSDIAFPWKKLDEVFDLQHVVKEGNPGEVCEIDFTYG